MRRNSAAAIAVAVSLVLVGTLSACTASTPATSQAPKPANIKLAFLPSFNAPYFIQEANGAKAEAKKLGISLVVQNSNGSDSTAVSSLQALVSTGGVQGVLIVVPTQQIATSVIKIAKDAKVSMIATDNELPNTPFVGFNWKSIGTQVGKLSATKFNAASWDASSTTAVSVELQTLATCNDRTDAETAAFLSSAKDFKKSNLIHLSYDGSTNAAVTAMAAAKTANPNTKHWVVWSCNDEGIVGAIKSLTSSGVPAADIIGIGLGADLACPTWKAGDTKSYSEAVFTDPARTAALGIKALYDKITKNVPIPASSSLPGVVVNPSNFTTIMKGYVNC